MRFPPKVSHYMWVIVGVIVGAHQQLPAHRFQFLAMVSHTVGVIVWVIVGEQPLLLALRGEHARVNKASPSDWTCAKPTAGCVGMAAWRR